MLEQYLPPLLVIALLFTVIAIFRAFWDLRLVKYIKDLSNTKIKNLKPGISMFQGNVEVSSSHDLLLTPLNKKKCIYYELRVDRRQVNLSGSIISSKWHNIYNDQKFIPFYLSDGTGKIKVNLDGVNTSLSVDVKKTLKHGDSPEFDKFCSQKDIPMKGLILRRKFRYYEVYIEPKDELSIIGNINSVPSNDSNEKTLICTADSRNKKIYNVTDGETNKLSKRINSLSYILPLYILIATACILILLT